MGCDSPEVSVCRQQRKPMLATGRRDQEIDRAGSNSFGPADGAEPCRSHIGLSVQLKKRKWVEEGEQVVELLRGPEAVEEFLEDISN
jgi:hypothetical protein